MGAPDHIFRLIGQIGTNGVGNRTICPIIVRHCHMTTHARRGFATRTFLEKKQSSKHPQMQYKNRTICPANISVVVAMHTNT
jgi:hypothetical protein